MQVNFTFLESWVWEHIYKTHKPKSDKVACIKCDLPLVISTSTIASHLKRAHRIDKPKPKNTGQLIQPTLKDVTETRPKPFDKNYADKLLTFAIATSSTSNVFVENKYFRKFLSLLKPDYKPISRNQVSVQMNDMCLELVSNMKSVIQRIDGFSFCIDFWSKDTTGFLGITANYFSGDHLNVMCLCLEAVPFPHTANTVALKTDEILKQWGFTGIADPKVKFIVTDNGSNMRKAYQNYDTILLDEDIPIQIEESDESSDNEESKYLTFDKRMPCTAHGLNNTVKASIMGSKRNKIDPCEPMKDVLCKIKSILRKVIRSLIYIIHFLSSKTLE